MVRSWYHDPTRATPLVGCPWIQDCVMEELKTLRAVQQNIRSKCAEEISLHMAPGIETANPGKTHIKFSPKCGKHIIGCTKKRWNVNKLHTY